MLNPKFVLYILSSNVNVGVMVLLAGSWEDEGLWTASGLKPPASPVACRIDQRIALIPRQFRLGGECFASVVQPSISPRLPGPAAAPIGWIIGLRSSITFLRLLSLLRLISRFPWVNSLIPLLSLEMRIRSSLDRMIWWEMPYWRNKDRISLSVSLRPCRESMRRYVRRSLRAVN
jgi:hypothetical protein